LDNLNSIKHNLIPVLINLCKVKDRKWLKIRVECKINKRLDKISQIKAKIWEQAKIK